MRTVGRQNRRKQLAIVAIVSAFASFTLWMIDWRSLSRLLEHTDWYQLLFATTFLLASFLLQVTGWRYPLPMKLGWWETFNVTAVSFAVSILTPFQIAPYALSPQNRAPTPR